MPIAELKKEYDFDMPVIRKIISFLVILGFVFFVVWIFLFNWSFVFKKRIVGEVAAVESVTEGLNVISSNNRRPLNPQVFSFSVAIKDMKTSEIHMASSEDRKWAAVQPGNCVVAAFFPYPPWQMSKGGTDFKARLLQNFVSCGQMPKEDPSAFWPKVKFFFLWF